MLFLVNSDGVPSVAKILRIDHPASIVTLTVKKNGSGAGTVTSKPAGISCGGDCSENYNTGTRVTLTPTPDTGSTFDGWGGDADCSNGKVTMDASKTCKATFNFETFTLEVTKDGTGTGTVSSSPTGIDCGGNCAATYNSGTPVTLTPTPAANSLFAGWGGDAGCSDGTVTMNADRTCTATFNLAPLTLTVTLEGSGTGTVTSDPPGISCASGAAGSTVFTAGGIVIADLAGQNEIQLTVYPGDAHPRLSPDRQWVAFWRGKDLLKVRSDGSDLSQLWTVATGVARHACWSPDGSQVAFAEGDSESTRLHRISADGTAYELLYQIEDLGQPILCSWADTGDIHIALAPSSPASAIERVACADDRSGCASMPPDATFRPADEAVRREKTEKSSQASGLYLPNDISLFANSGDCAEDYPAGTAVTLKPAAAAGSHFVKWTGHADCTDGLLTMDTAKSCTATFDPDGPALIFADGFESGDTSAWSKTVGDDSCVVPQDGTGALNGTRFGLECSVDGTKHRSYVEDKRPRDETTFKVGFLIDPNTLDMSRRSSIDVFRALQIGPRKNVLVITLKKTSRGFKVVFKVQEENGSQRLSLRIKGATRIAAEWAAATGSSSNDGMLQIFHNGKRKRSKNGLDTPFKIDTARFGVVTSKKVLGGSLFLDEYRMEG